MPTSAEFESVVNYSREPASNPGVAFTEVRSTT
jgi:hypothetical protein